MKKRNKTEMIHATLECLHELKKQIDRDPHVQISPIIESFNLNGALVDDLKKLHVIEQTDSHGKFWIGADPDVNMIHAIREMRKQYVSQYRLRKLSPMFVRQMPTGFKMGKNKPTASQREMIFDAPIDKLKIGHESVDQWQQRINEQKPIVTDVPIRTFDQSMVSEFINHDEPIIEKPVRKRTKTATTTERVFEFRLFGIKLFSIKY